VHQCQASLPLTLPTFLTHLTAFFQLISRFFEDKLATGSIKNRWTIMDELTGN
jgi:hypothetical protein